MSRQITRGVLLSLILIGFALRIHQLERFAYRGDESFTVQYWILQPLPQTLQNQTIIDPQPFLAYATYQVWGRLVGIDSFAVRMLPALVGTLGIAFMFRLAYHITEKPWLSLLASWLFAFHPFLIWHSQDARNYILWSTSSAAAFWFALRAIDCNRPRIWLCYVFFAALAAHFYYLELAVLFALTVYVFIAYRNLWRRWLMVLTGIIVLLLPWYSYLLFRLFTDDTGYGGTTSGFEPFLLVQRFFPTLLLGLSIPPFISSWVWIPLLLALFFSLFLAFRYTPDDAQLLVIAAYIPVLVIAVVSVYLNVFAPRYVLATIPFFLLLFVIFLSQWSRLFVVFRLVLVLPLMIFSILSFFSVSTYYNDYTKSPNWPALTAYLADHTQPNDLVIQAAADASFGLYYHHIDQIPTDERALPANPEQSPKDIFADLAEARASYEALWLVAQGFTDWPNYGVVESWLNTHMQRTIDTNASGLRIHQYRQWDVNSHEFTALATPIRFGDVAELVGLRVIAPPQPTGESIIWAYWRPLAPTPTPLKVFVHLTQNGQIIAQDDHEPQHGRARTDQWEPGRLYRDVYRLAPIPITTNSLALNIGLYDPQSNTRLLTAQGADAYTIEPISLR